ncbi:tRNA (adenosine(37)-N6)-threonylcarbamoyltransferase complex ATPase subunit type 1 TsaE [Anaerostipes butyraticus]|uniref:tRNA (adenosine(37)-N6)-threonylcarbamoyltransferase complex ATPase subunit type 1 TsaE n=1 Tax=Anaerostipes butyraticus TaxID=645466 RepID=UPI00320960DE
MEINIISNSENETIELGKKIAKNLKQGDIIILSGDLGSGKTKLTEGILSFFNLQDEISSPTFTIVNEYITEKLNIYHFDLYRLNDIDEFEAIGGEEYFEKGVCIIEWGEMIEEILPQDYIKIEFSRNLEDENKRNIKILKK